MWFIKIPSEVTVNPEVVIVGKLLQQIAPPLKSNCCYHTADFCRSFYWFCCMTELWVRTETIYFYLLEELLEFEYNNGQFESNIILEMKCIVILNFYALKQSISIFIMFSFVHKVYVYRQWNIIYFFILNVFFSTICVLIVVPFISPVRHQDFSF